MTPFDTFNRPHAFARFFYSAVGPFSFMDTSRNRTPFACTYFTRVGNFTGHKLPCVVLAEDYEMVA